MPLTYMGILCDQLKKKNTKSIYLLEAARVIYKHSQKLPFSMLVQYPK